MWHLEEPFKAYIHAQVKIIGYISRLVMQLLVLIAIIVTQCREIAQYSRSCREAACTLSIEKLLIREAGSSGLPLPAPPAALVAA